MKNLSETLKHINSSLDRQEVINWFNETEREYNGMTDLEMFAIYLESHPKAITLKTNKKYPNGFESWLDTFFFMSSEILGHYNENCNKSNTSEVKEYQDRNGHAGLKYLAEVWATEFESNYKTADWEEFDFYETLESFFKEKNQERPL